MRIMFVALTAHLTNHRLIFRRLAFVTALFCAPFAAAAEVLVETGSSGMVVSGHPEATAAGLTVLKAGGNAIDAAIAVSLALGVAEPYGSGLGGKLVLVYYDAKLRRVFSVDGLDRASFGLDVPVALGELHGVGRRSPMQLRHGFPGAGCRWQPGHRNLAR